MVMVTLFFIATPLLLAELSSHSQQDKQGSQCMTSIRTFVCVMKQVRIRNNKEPNYLIKNPNGEWQRERERTTVRRKLRG